MLHSSKDAKTRTPYASVWPPGLDEAGAMNSRCQSDVGGILSISISKLKIILTQTPSIVGNTCRREGKGLDSLGSAPATGIKVDTDEDRILEPVREIYSLFQGEVSVRVSSHHDLEAAGLKLLFQETGYSEIIFRLYSVAINCSGVIAAVTWVNNDGIEGGCGLDVGRSQDWIHQLAKVDPRNQITPFYWDDLEAEHELYIVHEHLLSANRKSNFDSLVLQLKK